MTVADAFNAMTSERIYRPSKKISEAISELNRVSGKQLDPVLVDAFASYEMTKISSELESYS
jgi:HD-GYP domain-containing protein (c-di-GMP phosphodiesterase class II)